MTTPVLAALLESIAGELPRVRSLDWTPDQLAHDWFVEKKLSLDLRGTLYDSVPTTYSLVICQREQLDEVELFLGEDGLVLVQLGDQPEPDSAFLAENGYELTGSVRTEEENWVLLAKLPQLHALEYTLSLVVVTQDDFPGLSRFLEDLAATPTDQKWELIIVDRDSWDQTPSLLSCLAGDIQLLRTERDMSAACAARLGVSRCRGARCVLANPRLVSGPQWLHVVLAAHEKAPFSVFRASTAFTSPTDICEIPIAFPRNIGQRLLGIADREPARADLIWRNKLNQLAEFTLDDWKCSTPRRPQVAANTG